MSSSKVRLFVGVDVGGKDLVVSAGPHGAEAWSGTFSNDTEGHRKLIHALGTGKGTVRVVVEATGTFHLDLALALAAKRGLEVMVANPHAARSFARANMRRAKTDKVDAVVLRDFAERMPFQPWRAPSTAMLRFRMVTRHMASLVTDQTVIKNRLSAAQVTAETPDFVVDDLEEQLKSIGERIARCQAEARRLVDADQELAEAFASLDSAPGIGERSAVLLLGELGLLDPSMSPDEVVGHAGLDPRPVQSGTRGNGVMARKISKVGNARVRAAMYMVALTASRQKGPVREFYERLTARNKPAFVAQVAVMRRMLRVAWVLMVKRTSWDPALFAPRESSVPPEG
jgi:transposase